MATWGSPTHQPRRHAPASRNNWLKRNDTPPSNLVPFFVCREQCGHVNRNLTALVSSSFESINPPIDRALSTTAASAGDWCLRRGSLVATGLCDHWVLPVQHVGRCPHSNATMCQSRGGPEPQSAPPIIIGAPPTGPPFTAILPSIHLNTAQF